MEAAREATAFENKLVWDDEAHLAKDLQAKGMQFIDVDTAEFVAAAKPVAPTLVIAANIAKISLDRITKAVWKFLVTMLVVLLLVTYVPALSTWLPGRFKN